MTALDETEWDEATKADAQPQCEMHLASRERCPEPAEWIVYSTCDDCDHPYLDLLCVDHFVGLADADVGCADCHTYHVYVTSMETL